MNVGKWIAWILSLALVAWMAGPSMAQSEPTLDQIYQAANAGRVNEARSMIDQVLKNHPQSAKAHYVKAELAARQGAGALARQELATAERIAPGLPFVRPESLRALKTQLGNLPSSSPQPQSRPMSGAVAPAPAAPSLPWGTLLIGAAVVVGVIALLRRRAAASAPYEGGTGPYGSGTPMAGGYGPAPGVPPATGPYPYGAPGAAPSMGSTLGRGLATGLAIGAGAVAAEEIGRRMFDHRGNPIAPDAATQDRQAANFGLSDPSSMDNPDMGGQDFGINDAGSWDDGGAMDAGDMGGGGWDT